MLSLPFLVWWGKFYKIETWHWHPAFFRFNSKYSATVVFFRFLDVLATWVTIEWPSSVLAQSFHQRGDPKILSNHAHSLFPVLGPGGGAKNLAMAQPIEDNGKYIRIIVKPIFASSILYHLRQSWRWPVGESGPFCFHDSTSHIQFHPVTRHISKIDFSWPEDQTDWVSTGLFLSWASHTRCNIPEGPIPMKLTFGHSFWHISTHFDTYWKSCPEWKFTCFWFWQLWQKLFTLSCAFHMYLFIFVIFRMGRYFRELFHLRAHQENKSFASLGCNAMCEKAKQIHTLVNAVKDVTGGPKMETCRTGFIDWVKWGERVLWLGFTKFNWSWMSKLPS